MKIVIQRVNRAQVTVNHQVIGSIDVGLLLFVGIGQSDSKAIASRVAQKIIALRIFADSEGKMNRSILEVAGEILAIPQFTLYASLKGQNRPFFGEAAEPEIAKELFYYFVKQLIKQGVKKVEIGEFGAYMQVELINDGPVTLVVDSSEI